MLLCDWCYDEQCYCWNTSRYSCLCHYQRRQVTSIHWTYMYNYTCMWHVLSPPPCITGYFDQQNSKTTISVNTDLVERSGDWVVVEWQYVDHPNTSDWLGLYSVPNYFNEHSIDPTKKAPIKFQVMYMYIHVYTSLFNFPLSSPPLPLSHSMLTIVILTWVKVEAQLDFVSSTSDNLLSSASSEEVSLYTMTYI